MGGTRVKPIANGVRRCTYTGRGSRVGWCAVLNIGRLAPGAEDYYIGEVATSAEDYYSGRGESPGRWVGSLARELGLVGTVSPEAFRAVLQGRHPITGQHLVSDRTATCRSRRLPPRNQPSLFDDDTLDVPQTAARLGLTTRRVRQLLAAGVRAAEEGEEVPPGSVLVGERVRVADQRGPLAWSIPRAEVERFEAEHRKIKARPGYDLTLRPPKSVSVLWALADDERRKMIRDCHRAAVNAVVDYYERHACYARRPTGDRGRVDTDGLIAAAFDHRTSRAGDPLLHTHVVCANLTRTAEGRWQAIDGRPVFEHAHAAGYLYQAHLRHELTRTLGIEFGTIRNGYAEIEGVPRDVIRAFSKRRDEIEELVAEAGYTSARAHQAATLASRKAKDYGVDSLSLEASWREEADDLGFGPEEVAACFDREVNLRPTDPDTLFDQLAGPEGLTQEASTFNRQDVVEAIAQAAGHDLPAAAIDELASRFVATPAVHALAAAPGEPGCGLYRRDGSRERAPDLARYTTGDLLALEQQVLTWAEAGFGTRVPNATPLAVEKAVARRPELSPEQVAMVRSVCTGAPAVQPVAGRPGSGKTHATAACIEAFVESGVPVVGCALSAVAAAELEAAAGLQERTGRPATTIARLLIDAREVGLAPGTVLVVDEASMVGTRDLARLGALVARAGGAMKLIGDPDQHGPVDTGGAFRRLIRQAPKSVPELIENNRQQDVHERQAVDEFRQELVELALSRYDSDGKVVRSRSAVESHRQMVDDWFAHVQAGGTDPMIAGTNRARRTLNSLARKRLADAGALSGLVLTAGDREFQAGDWIVTRRNASSLRSADRRHFVKNGSAGRVRGVHPTDGAMTVDFDVEGLIRLPREYLAGGHVEHAYARTSYGVQGATLGRAFYHPDDRSSFEEGYVALTRGRDETRIYLVDGQEVGDPDESHPGHDRHGVGLETIAEALERRRSKTLALDADPLAEASRQRFGGWSLAQLRAERDQLEAVLGQVPRPADEALASAERQRDAILARRQAWERVTGGRQRRGLLGRRRMRTPQEEITAADKALANIERHIEALRRRTAAHDAFMADHVAESEQLHLVYRAELARELRVRADAIAEPHPSAIASLGLPPSEPEHYQRWRDALERAAVHADRFGADADPADASVRYSSERVRDAFLAAAEPPSDGFAPEAEVLLDA